MQKTFFTMLFILCAMMNISFASPTENGIDDFYFGQPLEEIKAQYELTDREYTVEDGAIINYKTQAPSLDFYGVKISQPITLGFKNDKLCKITFDTNAVSLAEAENQQKMITNFASIQYGVYSSYENQMKWTTDKMSLFITYNKKDNSAYFSISMNENNILEIISKEENTISSETQDTPVAITELSKDMNPIQAQLYVLCKVKLNASLEEVSNKIHLIKNIEQTQMKNTDIITYNSSLKEPYMYEVTFEDRVDFSFYQKHLEHVFLMFTGNGTQLQKYLTERLGTPTIKEINTDSLNAISYSWVNGDYGLNLLLYNGRGHLNFYYVPYQQEVTRISLLEYANYLKSSPANMRYLESLIKTDPQYKESFKNQMKNVPEYEQALKDAGMDMSIFN